ncbi:uncharacterized protein DUF397 [Actinomadura pelletieri DSM 43383]|uniref:Uncharacterized protein DUF397 n=1 Tax=Actinomadura pelletieri DSM 43383 TaxID=1120940 RepID=A0A495QU94_9ACTN|nr:DUF397 domain-containing protein [Actinomadura pelletieri]RKS77112.1 uncharacterized protein DUF397 [Actinomadura pelletieri DSM 43383]
MPVQWRKSTHSSGVDDQHCVELGRLASGVGVRDSKAPETGHLALTAAQFAVLLAELKQGGSPH